MAIAQVGFDGTLGVAIGNGLVGGGIDDFNGDYGGRDCRAGGEVGGVSGGGACGGC